MVKHGTLNIQDGKNTRLNHALQCLSQMEVDIAMLTETKFMDEYYTQGFMGYKVVAMKAELHKGELLWYIGQRKDGIWRA